MDILSVDIGGTFVKYAKMNDKLEFLSKGRVPAPKNREELVDIISRIYKENLPLEGIAISMAGIIDSQKGLVVMGGGQFPFNTGFYLRDALKEKCPVKIYMENDAKAAAMAEASYGSLRDVEDGYVLLFGTMIGGCLIINHRPYHGTHFSAGEVSYIFDDKSDFPAAENVWGNICSVKSLLSLYGQRKNIPPEHLSGETVFEAVKSGEPEAAEALDIYARNIAVQIFNIQTVLDPKRIAIGGGISAQPLLLEYINKHLDLLYENCYVKIPRAEVTVCRFGNDANLIGALACFMDDL